MPAGLSAVTINNAHEPPCVCSTAEGLPAHGLCEGGAAPHAPRAISILLFSLIHGVLEQLWKEREGERLTQCFSLDCIELHL